MSGAELRDELAKPIVVEGDDAEADERREIAAAITRMAERSVRVRRFPGFLLVTAAEPTT